MQTQRFVGTFAVRMDYTYYPGDKHALPLEIELFGNPSDTVQFNRSWASCTMLDGAASSSLWHISSVDWGVATVIKPSTGLGYDRLTVHFNTERVLMAYLLTTYLPLILLLLVAWCTFYLDPKAVPARTALTIICLLASVTYYGTVKADLPTVGYFTYLDIFCVMVIMGAVISIFSFVRVHYWIRRGMAQHDEKKSKNDLALISEMEPGDSTDYEERAPNFDKFCRRSFPIYIFFSCFLILVPIIRSFSDTYDHSDLA